MCFWLSGDTFSPRWLFMWPGESVVTNCYFSVFFGHFMESYLISHNFYGDSDAFLDSDFFLYKSMVPESTRFWKLNFFYEKKFLFSCVFLYKYFNFWKTVGFFLIFLKIMTFQLFHSTLTLKHFENKYNLQRFVFKSMPSKNYAVKKLYLGPVELYLGSRKT